MALPRLRNHLPVHNGRRRDGGDVCRHAIPHPYGGVWSALNGSPLRRGSASVGGKSLEGVHPGDASSHRPISVRGRRVVLGPGARRVRRHDHLRGQLPRRHPDHAACRLPPAGDKPGSLVHPEPGVAVDFAGGVGRTQAPLAWLGVSLEASIRLTLGPLDLEMEVTIDEGEVVALLGPNGSGKTTYLRAIAGLVPFNSGYVRLDGKVLEDTATRQYIPTERRPVGFVFQDYLLFPHLNVLDNVA